MTAPEVRRAQELLLSEFDRRGAEIKRLGANKKHLAAEYHRVADACEQFQAALGEIADNASDIDYARYVARTVLGVVTG